jgi:predicted dienelactone hydrolase
MVIDIFDSVGGARFSAEVMGGDDRTAAAPLALLSHGNGGSYRIYRALNAALVAAGWVVAALDHPGNNRRDNRLGGSRQNLEDRPRHLSLLLDAVLGRVPIDPRRIAAIGHSLGGATALFMAGATGTTRDHESLRLKADARVQALVLLAPAAFWFMAPDALRAVTVPLLILEGEHDDITPGWHGDLIAAGVAVRARVSRRIEAGAGHFSFISPFPQALRRPDFPPAQDPPGFDREAFHRRYPAEVLAYLDRVLPAGPA